MTPTDHGLLLRRARELVDAANALDSEVLLRRVSGLGQLNIGAGPYPAETIVPMALARFMSENPSPRERRRRNNSSQSRRS